MLSLLFSSSAFRVSQKNFSMVMLNKLRQCTTCSKECRTQNFIPMKLKELLAEKCPEVLYLVKL